MMNHVMLDLETLGQGSNSVITSIGAVQFDIVTGQTGKKFKMNVDIDSCLGAGLKIESGTVLWWLKQSEAARNNFIAAQYNSSVLLDVLDHLTKFLNYLPISSTESFDVNDLIMWGRGPRFDFGILNDAYKACGMESPWNFRNEMCVRTMEFLRPQIKKNILPVDVVGHGSEGGGTHDAVLDCLYQIEYVSNIFNNLNSKND